MPDFWLLKMVHKGMFVFRRQKTDKGFYYKKTTALWNYFMTPLPFHATAHYSSSELTSLQLEQFKCVRMHQNLQVGT